MDHNVADNGSRMNFWIFEKSKFSIPTRRKSDQKQFDFYPDKRMVWVSDFLEGIKQNSNSIDDASSYPGSSLGTRLLLRGQVAM